jgi:hypothetical protein
MYLTSNRKIEGTTGKFWYIYMVEAIQIERKSFNSSVIRK